MQKQRDKQIEQLLKIKRNGKKEEKGKSIV